MQFHRTPLLGIIFITILVIILPLLLFTTRQPQETQQHASGGFPHVVGTQIVDENGNLLLLHGAQLEGMLNGNGTQVPQNYTSIVSTMAAWHMNAIRLPSCNWFWKADPTGYMNKIQMAVQQANQAGLYVIIDLHDDHNCSPPYPWPEPYHLPRPEMDTYWQAVATTLKNNPKVIFDIYNEPNIQGVAKTQYTDAQWKLWLNGGTVQDALGTETFIGMQHLVDVIRQTGAQQILMAEGYTAAETFHNIGTNTLSDPLHNVVYEAHKYSLLDGVTQWDSDFGFMTTQYPVFVGEWALLGGDNSGQTNCGGVISSAQADQVVSAFLNYLDARHMGWTAYSFDAEHVITDYINFTPTTFFPGWVCPQRGTNTINHAGMGQDIKNYLANNQLSPTVTASPTPTQTVTPTSSNTPTPTFSPNTTVITVSLCPHGLGACGDNVSPSSSGGNTNPLHTVRNVMLTITDTSAHPVTSSPFSGMVQYIPSSQNFQGTISIPHLGDGQYLIFVKMDGFLAKQIPGIITISQGKQETLPAIALVTGDINNDNQVDIQDYNILISCFGQKITTPSCPQQYRPSSSSPGTDISDDGQVDGIDYNVFIRELSVQKGG